MLNQELLEVKKYREEVKRDYSEYQNKLHNDCVLIYNFSIKKEKRDIGGL